MISQLIGKKIGSVEFVEKDGQLVGKMLDKGVSVEYKVPDAKFEGPAEAVLMDLDGTTVTSEEFWMYLIEASMQKLLKDPKFSLEDADAPFVAGFTTDIHLEYCLNKYAQDKTLVEARDIYNATVESELAKIMRGEGRVDAFKPTPGLKEFLLELKRRKIKIALVTSGLDYKAIPEITAAFKSLDMGDPLKFYDAVITGGRRKGTGDYGSIGEVAAKPHPWIYTEVAYMGLRIANPLKTVGIEDSAAGAMALRFGGFPTIGLNGGNISRSGADALCMAKVDKLSEILDII